MMLQETTISTPTHTRTRRRPSPTVDEDTEEAMRQVRVAIRTMLGGRTLEQSAGLVDVSTNTLTRILRGENLTMATFARIVARLGGHIVIKVERLEHWN